MADASKPNIQSGVGPPHLGVGRKHSAGTGRCQRVSLVSNVSGPSYDCRQAHHVVSTLKVLNAELNIRILPGHLELGLDQLGRVGLALGLERRAQAEQ